MNLILLAVVFLKNDAKRPTCSIHSKTGTPDTYEYKGLHTRNYSFRHYYRFYYRYCP